MKNFLFIRHGATRGNLERRYIGRTDEPICAAAAPFTDMPPHTDFNLYVSPMLRCRQTAASLFPGKAGTVIEDLRECDFGIFEGKTAGELEKCSEYAAWLNTGCEGDIPGGESVQAFKNRSCQAFSDIASRDCEGLTVIVTHGGIIMAILERYGWPERQFYEYHLPNLGALTRRYTDGFLVE